MQDKPEENRVPIPARPKFTMMQTLGHLSEFFNISGELDKKWDAAKQTGRGQKCSGDKIICMSESVPIQELK